MKNRDFWGKEGESVQLAVVEQHWLWGQQDRSFGKPCYQGCELGLQLTSGWQVAETQGYSPELSADRLPDHRKVRSVLMLNILAEI